MKKTIGATFIILLLTGVALNGVAQAEYSGGFEVDAVVLGVSERYKVVKEMTPVRECRDVEVSTGGGSTSSDTPELVGALIGGAIGKEIDDTGKSSTVIGALLGASIASDIEKKQAASQATTRIETRCTTVQREVETERLDGYNVSYEYEGNVYRARTPTRPGETIRVRILAVPVNFTN